MSRLAAEKAVRALPGVTGVFATLTAEREGGAARAQLPRPHPAPRARDNRRPSGIPGRRACDRGRLRQRRRRQIDYCGQSRAGTCIRWICESGLLDADIYGPSVPKLLGIHGKPKLLEGRILEPMEAYGLKVMSIGFLVEEEAAMIWRGPMVMSAITQMLREVAWGDLDVLVVDMPPGTGDAQLTMAQATPLAGAVIVSTPQDLALIDARRGVSMFKRVEIPILGIVENMATFICPHCGTASPIFGHGGARHEAERLGVPFLGEVPLTMSIRESSDAGRPVVAMEPDGAHAADLQSDGRCRLNHALAGTGTRAAPRIVIE